MNARVSSPGGKQNAHISRSGTFYILSEEPGCHKKIRSISDYEKRTYLANNIRKKYLNNEYAGLPIIDNINLQDLLDRFSSDWEKI